MSLETVTAYVGLGSNLGDRAGNLLYAVRGLHEAGVCVKRLSAVYETVPVEVENHPEYLNMVIEAEIRSITPEQMLARMLRIEYLLGRRREQPRGARTVDLDLLLFGNQRHQTEFLTLPHPQLHLRRFVLVPLDELAPRFVHPVSGSTIHELLKTTPDKSQVVRWQPAQTFRPNSSVSLA